MKSKLKKPHRHPPQPRRNFISHKAEANKSMIIGIIAVIAIVGLGLLLFFSKQFVGQAIKIGLTEPKVGEAGIFIQSGSSVEVDDIFTVPIKVNIGKAKSVAVGFELTYPAGVLTADCSKIFEAMDARFTSIVKGNLAVIRTANCTPEKIKFEYVGLCSDNTCGNAISGNALITEITFTANKSGENPIGLLLSDATFTVVDLDTDEDLVVAQVNNGYITITEKAITSCPEGQILQNGECFTPCPTGKGDQCSITDKSKCSSDNSQILSCVSTPCGNRINMLTNCTAEGKVCESGACVSPAQVCGNGIIEGTETCDTNNFKDNCTTYGFSGGTPTCNNCSINYGGCTLSNKQEPCYLISGWPVLQGIISTCKTGLMCNLGICMTSEDAATLTCGDTDAYLPNEFLVKGTVKTKSPEFTLTDSCGANDVLKEQICAEGKNVSLEMNCDLGYGFNYSCKEGACVNSGFKCNVPGQNKAVGDIKTENACANRIKVNDFVNMSFIKDLTCIEVYRGVPIVKVPGSSGQLSKYQYLKINPSNVAFASGSFVAVSNGSLNVCPAEIKTNPTDWFGPSTADPLALNLLAAERCIDEGKSKFLFYESSCDIGTSVACPVGKECCGGITEINLQTDVNNCGACNKKCSQGETCQSGTCAVATLGKCIDPDKTYTPSFNENNASFNSSSLKIATTVEGFNVGGTTLGNFTDVCSNTIKVMEIYCVNETHYTWNGWDCPSGTSCSMGACVSTEASEEVNCDTDEECIYALGEGFYCDLDTSLCALSTVEEEVIDEIKVPVLIELFPKLTTGEISTSSVLNTTNKNENYNVKITLRPDKELPANHLVIVALDYGGIQKTLFWDAKPILNKGSAEVISFDHQMLNASNLKIKVFVWEKWPSENNWSDLLQEEKSYEIK